MPRFSILFVCSANVCRSPTALSLTSRALKELDVRRSFSLQSAGVEAAVGAEWCIEAGDWLSRNRPTDGEAGPSAGTPVTRDMLSRADLVLAADRQTTGSLLRQAPRSRPHVFTLREAQVLGKEAASTIVRQLALPTSSTGLGSMSVAGTRRNERLGWWVAEMDNTRGLVPLGGPYVLRSGPLRRRREVPSTDIPDVHLSESKLRHRDVMPLLVTCVDDITTSIGSVLNAPT